MMTVSNVINGTGKVSDQTRARVRQAIRNTGYVPNYEARRVPHTSRTLRCVVSVPVKCVEIRINLRCSVLWSLGSERLSEPRVK